MKLCPNCRKQNFDHARYCSGCGQYLAQEEVYDMKNTETVSAISCPSCGADNPSVARYCRRCGTMLSAYQVESITQQTTHVQTTDRSDVTLKQKRQRKKVRVVFIALPVFMILAAGYYYMFHMIRKTKIFSTVLTPSEQEQKVDVKGVLTLSFPPGFITAEQQLDVYRVRNLPAMSPGVKVADAFDFQLQGHERFEFPVYCEMAVPQNVHSRDIQAGYYNEQTGKWEPIPFFYRKSGNRIEFPTEHFSTFAWGTAETAPEPSPMMRLERVPFPSGQMLHEAEKNNLLEKYSRGLETQSAIIDGWNVFSEWVAISGNISTIAGDLLEQPAFQSVNQIMPEIGLGFALVQAGIDFKDGNYSKATLELTKNIGNFYAGKFINTVALNVAMVGVFAIDYSLNKFAQEAISSRNQIYDQAYRNFYRDYNKANKINTVWWYKQFRSIIRQSKTAQEAEENIKNLLDRYVYQFWDNELVVAQYLEQQGLSFTGGGGLNEQLKKQISENYKSELVHVFHNIGLLDRLKKESAFEAARRLYERLEKVREHLNKVYQVNIKVESEDENLKTGGLPVFFRVSNPAHKQLWQTTTDKDGTCIFRFTLLGFMNAGCPSEVCTEIEVEGKKEQYCSAFKVNKSTISVTITIGEPKLEGVYMVEILSGKVYQNGKVISQFTKADIQRSYDMLKEYQQQMPDEYRTGEYGHALQQGIQGLGMIGSSKYPLNMTEVSKRGTIKREGKYYIIQYSEPVPYYGGTHKITYRIQFVNSTTFEGTCEMVTSVHGSTTTTVYEVKGQK